MQFSRILLLLLLLAAPLSARSGGVDSLLRILSTAQEDTNKVLLLHEVAQELRYSQLQGALDKARQALKLSFDLKYDVGIARSYNLLGTIYDSQGDYYSAMENFEKGLKQFEKQGDLRGMALADNNIGEVYRRRGDYGLAMDYYEKSLKLLDGMNDRGATANVYNNMGRVHVNKGDVQKAISYYEMSLKELEGSTDKRALATYYDNIGVVYSLQGNIPAAIEHYQKSLQMRQEIRDKHGIAASYKSMGELYKSQGNYVMAEDFFNKSLELGEFLGSKLIMSSCYLQLADLSLKTGNTNEAESYARMNIRLSEEINDIEGLASAYNSMGGISRAKGQYKKAAEHYANSLNLSRNIGNKELIGKNLLKLAALAYEQKKYAEAKLDAESALELAQEVGYPEQIRDAAGLLGKVYRQEGNFEKALYYHTDIYAQMNDSMMNAANTKLITQMETRHQLERQEKEIDLLHKEQTIRELRMKRQYTIGVALLLGLIAMTVFAFYFVRSNRMLKRQNEQIQRQKEQIQEQLNRIEAQKERIEVQLERIEAQQEDITASIRYASFIQTALLPLKEQMDLFVKEHFVFYRPRDIVSGDFYWMKEVSPTKFLIGVADCTGHGVPGALMSMLGIAFLNDISSGRANFAPDQMLADLREKIKQALHQTGKRQEAKDGMDIALCVVDLEAMELHFGGANRPMVIIRNGKAINLKGDRMPIGIHYWERDFSSQTVALEKGDQIYMFSDGYVDQFGGEKQMKFMRKPFREMLLNNANEPMVSQKMKLKKAFEDWKGELEQVDDILVLGMKI